MLRAHVTGRRKMQTMKKNDKITNEKEKQQRNKVRAERRAEQILASICLALFTIPYHFRSSASESKNKS